MDKRMNDRLVWEEIYESTDESQMGRVKLQKTWTDLVRKF